MTSLTLTKSFVNDNVHWFYVFIKILDLKKINCDIRSYLVFTLESSAFIKRHVCNLSFYVPDWYVFIYRRAFFRSFTRNQCIFHGVICMVMLKCVTWIRTILVVFFSILSAITWINGAYVLFWFCIQENVTLQY